MNTAPASIFRGLWPAPLALLLLLFFVVSGPGARAQALAVAATDNIYTVQSGPAPEIGGAGVFTLAGPPGPGAVLQWQRKPAGATAFTDVPEAAPYRGTTVAALHIDAATAAMDGDEFRCLVREAGGTVAASAPAALRVGPPLVSILGGDRQTTEAGRFNALPFDLAVWDAAGVHPLVDQPVTFTVRAGGGLLALAGTAAAALAPSLTLKTDQDGTVQAWYRHGGLPGVQSEIAAAAGSREVTFFTTSLGAGADTAAATTGTNGELPPGKTPARSPGAKSSLSARALAARNVDKEGALSDTATLRALAVTTGRQLKLMAAVGQYFSVDTTNWAITSAPGP